MTRRAYRAEWAAKWRHKQRARGLCTCCPQPAVPGMTLCVRHHVGKLMRHGKGSTLNTAWTRYLLAIKADR